MNKKERTIVACRELAEKYRNPRGKIFFDVRYCSLCKIYCVRTKDVLTYCTGCFMASETEETDDCPGCIRFRSYWNALTAYHGIGNIEIKDAYKARAEFFDKIIPIMEKAPTSQFTKRGWKPFNIPLDW